MEGKGNQAHLYKEEVLDGFTLEKLKENVGKVTKLSSARILGTRCYTLHPPIQKVGGVNFIFLDEGK